MKKLFLTFVVIVLVSVLTFASCAQPAPAPVPTPAPTIVPAPRTVPAPAPTSGPAPAPVKPIELRLASHSPPTHFSSVVFDQFAKKVQEQTGGKVKITLFLSGTLGPPTQYWLMLKGGAIDIAWLLPFYFAGTFPLTEVFDQPIFPSYDKATPAVLNTLFSKYISKDWSEAKVLWPAWITPLNLHMAKKPVNTLEDLKGKQIRSIPGAYSLVLRALGATPVELATGEVYSAVEKGMVEGFLIGTEAVISQKLNEVSKYHLTAEFNIGTTVTAMNLEKWNSLPPDVQKVFDQLTPWAQEEMGKLARADVENAISKLKTAGHTITSLSPEERARWQQATKSLVDSWVQKIDAKGLPASALINETRGLMAGQ